MRDFPQLIVVQGEVEPSPILLNRATLRLGRDPARNDVVLPASDQHISRQHLELVEEFGRWSLVDYSRNGVRINGVVVRHSRHELQHGDRIVIGDSVELMYDDPNSTFSAELADKPADRLTGLRVELDTFSVWRDGVLLDVEWSSQEMALLHYLYQQRGQLCRYTDIIERVWGSENPTYGREHVHELVARVRRKLEHDPSQPVYLVTRPGMGYLLNALL